MPLKERVLNQQGYVVDWVTNGLWAWDYLENPRIHYILAVFDGILPGLPGVELCYRLRQQDNSLLVLMLTASEQMDERIMGLDAGADDCLSEPFWIAELLARLRARDILPALPLREQRGLLTNSSYRFGYSVSFTHWMSLSEISNIDCRIMVARKRATTEARVPSIG